MSETPPADADVLPWYERIAIDAFIDSYYSLNYQTPKPQGGRNRFRAFDQNNGFSVAWAGLNLAYSDAHFGGVLELRFGPSAGRLAGADADAGLENVKQAYASWRPGGADGILTLDIGKFDTFVGAEVADSHLNYNYSRGLLFWLAQPYYHTGLRANLDLSDQVWLTGLVANGWNNSVDNNFGKTFGLQVNFATAPAASGGAPLFDAHLAYIVGPEQQDYAVIEDYCDRAGTGETFNPFARGCDTQYPGASSDLARDLGGSNSELRHLIDLVVGVNPSPDLSLVANFDLGFDRGRVGSLVAEQPPGFTSQSFWGVSAAGRYQFTPQWAGALRAEILQDADGRVTASDDPYIVNVQDLALYEGTLTAEYAPVPNLILRLDNRLDYGNERVFQRLLRTYEQWQFTTTLGVVVATN